VYEGVIVSDLCVFVSFCARGRVWNRERERERERSSTTSDCADVTVFVCMRVWLIFKTV